MARGQYHGRTTGMAPVSARRPVAATQHAGGRSTQPTSPQGDLLAIYRRTSAGGRRAANDPAGEGPAFRAVRTLAETPNPIVRRSEQSHPFSALWKSSV